MLMLILIFVCFGGFFGLIKSKWSCGLDLCSPFHWLFCRRPPPESQKKLVWNLSSQSYTPFFSPPTFPTNCSSFMACSLVYSDFTLLEGFSLRQGWFKSSPVLSQPLQRWPTASWRRLVWRPCRCQGSAPLATGAASTRPSSASGNTAGVWTQPTARWSQDPWNKEGPGALLPFSLVSEDNWSWSRSERRIWSWWKWLYLCFQLIQVHV